jgi:meiotic recombination protein REC8
VSKVPIDTQTVVNVENDRMEIDTHAAGPTLLGEKDGQNVIEESIEIPRVRIPRVKRPKEITSDDTTALRNITLAQWNNEYLTNMVQALNQKQQNKVPTIAKKNAAFWVFGQGIGSVGLGLGMEQESHPLNIFSGEDLFESIGGYGEHSGQKHTRTEDDFDSEGRRVRAREEQAEHLSCENIDRLSMDVELGRDAPSSLFDDHSSQMPWNITASIKSSHRPHRFGSVSELSSQGRKARSRLTSASPLASRYGGQDRLSLDLGDFGDDLDLTRYLEGELATDREGISSISPGKRSLLEQAKASLDRESLNFFDFMKTKMGVEKSAQSPRSNDSPWTVSANGGRTTFATLMPPESTTRAVATQALMNVLTLATKGLLRVYQDQCSAEWGGYRSGEIQLRFSEM